MFRSQALAALAVGVLFGAAVVGLTLDAGAAPNYPAETVSQLKRLNGKVESMRKTTAAQKKKVDELVEIILPEYNGTQKTISDWLEELCDAIVEDVKANGGTTAFTVDCRPAVARRR